MDQLGTIVAVLGTSNLHAYMSKYKIEKTPDIHKVIAKYTLRGRGPPQSWEELAIKQFHQQQQQSNDADEATSTNKSSSPTTSPTKSPNEFIVSGAASNKSFVLAPLAAALVWGIFSSY